MHECPNCGSDEWIVETALFLDPETDEVDGRELQCITCSHIWEQWLEKPVQTGMRVYL